jgi:hypothetical protein
MAVGVGVAELELFDTTEELEVIDSFELVLLIMEELDVLDSFELVLLTTEDALDTFELVLLTTMDELDVLDSLELDVDAEDEVELMVVQGSTLAAWL